MSETKLRPSLARQLAEAVIARGRATVDDLQPLFPHATRRQLHNALSNARKNGLIGVLVKGSGPIGGRGCKEAVAGVWGPNTDGGPPQRPIRAVVSVFHMASGPVVVPVWRGQPPQAHHLVGEW